MTLHVILAMLCFIGSSFGFGYMLGHDRAVKNARRRIKLAYMIGYHRGTRDQYNKQQTYVPIATVRNIDR